MKAALPTLLAVNAGYVDTAGFLALHGLFTTHVTGNFVTLGAALVLGTSGAVAKLLALPVFCAVVWGTRVVTGRLAPASLRAILLIKLLLLAAGGALIIGYGPFADGDGGMTLAAGLLLVAAMAIQNALQRIHLAQFPPTTIMTGNLTQFMVDLADLTRGAAMEDLDRVRSRAWRLGLGLAAFAAGCALGALLYAGAGVWCFLVPPALTAVTLALAPVTPALDRPGAARG